MKELTFLDDFKNDLKEFIDNQIIRDKKHLLDRYLAEGGKFIVLIEKDGTIIREFMI